MTGCRGEYWECLQAKMDEKGAAMKGKWLLREKRYADVETSYVFDGMKLRNCQEHRKKGDKALERGWDCPQLGAPGTGTWIVGRRTGHRLQGTLETERKEIEGASVTRLEAGLAIYFHYVLVAMTARVSYFKTYYSQSTVFKF